MNIVNRVRFLIFAFMILICSQTFAAKGGNFGAGFMLGSPSSLNAKYFESDKIAFDFGLAFDTDDYIMIYGDYLVHFPGSIRTESPFINSLNPYVGVGPFLAFSDGDRYHQHKFFDDPNDDFALGVRVPLGVEWRATEIPLGVAVEIGPGISVIPSTDVFVTAGIAFRYYF